jgi:hypothetical protein
LRYRFERLKVWRLRLKYRLKRLRVTEIEVQV